MIMVMDKYFVLYNMKVFKIAKIINFDSYAIQDFYFLCSTILLSASFI